MLRDADGEALGSATKRSPGFRNADGGVNAMPRHAKQLLARWHTSSARHTTSNTRRVEMVTTFFSAGQAVGKIAASEAPLSLQVLNNGQCTRIAFLCSILRVTFDGVFISLRNQQMTKLILFKFAPHAPQASIIPYLTLPHPASP